MFQRSLVAILAALGGILVILGGILGFLLSFAPGGYGMRDQFAAAALVYGVLAVIFGLVIVAFSGYTHYRGVERSLTGGVILIVLGAVTWIVVGGWVLVAVGSFLAVLAGLLLMAEVFFASPSVRTSPSP
jgi:Flp pilus assembly pilin Flp